jgi:NAD(P)-dependent dehydrogenase (short-subunit alcohol dehydrogenase family)
MAKTKGWLLSAGLATGASLGLWLLGRSRRLSLAGRTVVVTGASRGLGLLIARELARAQCRLVICARDAAELEYAERSQVDHLIDRALERFREIDVVINNAAILSVGPLETMTLGDFDAALKANFWGMVHVSLAVLPHMRARHGGRIVNITSIGGKVAVPHLLPYDAAKFAAVGFSEGLTAEVAKDGILVTTVVPGLMRTGSAVNVEYHGSVAREYLWFALGDATPLTSMDGVRAARRIVRALVRGETEVTLSWQAKLVRLVHALAPATTIRALGLVNRLLPAPVGGDTRRPGYAIGLPRPVEKLVRPSALRAGQYGLPRA